MPLHLLGKKSWNVYNPENIARVQRDEAEARAKEAEDERRRQDVDSDRRLELLRGGSPSTARDLPAHEGAPRKRVKHGHESVAGRGETLQPTQQHNNAPIVDRDGHIDLVSGHDQIDRSSKNRKPAEGNGQAVGMRLADAGGYGSRDSKPWYSTSAPEVRAGQFEVGRDVWGNEDVRRAHRDRQRIDKNDPLAAMKRGVKQLKQAEAERAEWKAQRESDLNEVEELAAKRSRRHSKHRRRRRESSAGSLEDFNLDEDDVEGRQRIIAAITTIIARVTDTEAEKGIVREALILRAKHDSVAPAQCSNFH